MKILGHRFLRGPNIHGTKPCYVAVLHVEELDRPVLADLLKFDDRLKALMAFDPAVSSVEAQDPAQLVVRLTLALQALAGAAADFGHVVRTALAPPGDYRVVCGYQLEAVVARALAMAVDLLTALMTQQPFDLDRALGELRSLGDERAIDPSYRALLNAALERDIPVLRLSDDQRHFQLGWGIHQRRLLATPPGEQTQAPTLESIFPPGGTARIPVVAITGTNGKTTTTLLIAHVIRASGACTGTTTTQGVFIDGRCIESGDCTGYWSARTVLTHDGVQVATLETARGGILKRGLAFDRCDVGVVLNVSSDHLGLDGVQTLADLAHLKGLVARSAATAAVLNAEDSFCVGMRETLREGCKPVFFSMSADHSVLRDHLEAGGRGACLDDGWLVWCDAGRRERVVEAVRLPFTVQGHARYNIANALAALAALRCMGLQTKLIGEALASFVSDAKSNPLRANQFELSGIRLIVDYAHNVVAYRALCAMARSLLEGQGRLLGVITSPGDRRATDLFETGQVCGEGFDELVVYEQDPRGRGAGETTHAILAGARSAAPLKPLHAEPQIRRALMRGLRAARPGDTLVFTCAGTFDDLVEGVRLFDPAAADGIAREISA